MIPVRQTRFDVATVGNCWEACIASILEVPLSAVPDRADYVDDLDVWADLVHQTTLTGGMKAVAELEVPWSETYDDVVMAWLAARGLGLIRWDFEARMIAHRDHVLETLRDWHRGLWIGSHLCGAMSHAVVYQAGTLVHNPWPEAVGLGELVQAEIFTAASPRMIVRTLGPELLPDVAGAMRGVTAGEAIGELLDRAGYSLPTL